MDSPLGFVVARRRRRLARRIALGALFALAAAAGSWMALYLFQSTDVDVRQIEDLRPSIITRIYAHDGEVIGEFAQERRILITDDQIPPALREAIVAVEDADFYRHHGINPRGIMRAMVKNAKAGRWVEGGSSLTQQLAKMLFLTPEKSLRRKLREAVVALHLERTYSKGEILQFYCNQIYLGHNRYGVEAASRFYFGKHVGELSLGEAALIAGLPQRPSAYSPYHDPRAATDRRNHVLDRMASEGFISQAEAVEAKSQPIVLQDLEGDAPGIAPYFVEEVRQHLERTYGEKALYHDGLNVHTTLDPAIQDDAEAALRRGLLALDKRQGWRGPDRNVLEAGGVADLDDWSDPGWERQPRAGEYVRGLVTGVDRGRATVRIGALRGTVTRVPSWLGGRRLDQLLRRGDVALFHVDSVSPEAGTVQLELDQEPEVEGALVALDVRTGQIRAMVGGWDFTRSKFNRAVQARRQTGSSFKPILYAAAFANGFTPADSLFDEPIAIEDPWSGTIYSPENYTKTYYGLTTLREALEKSRNPISVQLLQQVGAHTVIDLSARLGLTAKLDPYPSLALGAFEETLLEMTSAFSAFADLGVVRVPYMIERVADRDGTALAQYNPVPRQALSPEVAFITNYLMQGVVQSGTATSARTLGRPLAGKTGTTDDFTDAWFIGFSPELVVGVWVGFDVKRTLGKGEVGARAALPIWIDFMEQALRDQPVTEFTRPPGVEFVTVDKTTGLRATDACASPFPEAFVRGTAPVTYCSARDHEVRSLPYYLQKIYLSGGTLPPMASGDVAPTAVH